MDMLSVREITKSISTFSATNYSSNIVWLFQLHDTIRMKLNYIWITYDHDNITIRSHIMIYNGTKFSNIHLAKGEKRSVFQLWFVNLQRANDATHAVCLMQNIDICLLYKSHQIYLTGYATEWYKRPCMHNQESFCVRAQPMRDDVTL